MLGLWEAIKTNGKKVLMWLGAVFAAIFTVLFIGECQEKNKKSDPVIHDDSEEINVKACKKREEAINRIHNADARTVAEGYGSVCDTIAEGKERFRKRCQEWTDYEDIRR